ncbi:MAG: sulfatase family protein [Planctomycetota bacterium]|jgi:choline-sulfatase
MTTAKDNRLNILLLLVDEMRWDCMGCAGNSVIHTPNLDRLAAMGVRFRDAYSTSPLCVPARTQMLTGLPCWQTEVWGLSDRLIPAIPTFATALSQAGYYTGAVGKMHFESCNGLGNIHEPHGFQELILSEEVLPTDTQPDDDYTQYLLKQGYDLGRYTHGRRSPDHGQEGFRAQISDLPNQHFDTTWTGDQALAMIDAHAHEPFCIKASFVKPHFPCELPNDWPCPYTLETIPFRDSYLECPDPDLEAFNTMAAIQGSCKQQGWLEESTLRAFAAYYYGNIELVDTQVGRILDSLEEKGLLDSTLILFTSDHGEGLGERGCLGKAHHYEESAQVPMILAGPMIQDRGRVDARMVQLEDICPTILEAAGLSPFANMTGESMLPLLADPEREGREAVYGIIGGSYHFEANEALTFMREGNWKYMYQFDRGAEKLYNLGEDPCELTNLAETEPRRCQRMNQALAAWFDRGGAGWFTIQGRLRKNLGS